jgi:hypothetical protein
VQVPAQTAHHPGPFGHQVVAVIDEQAQLAGRTIQAGGRQVGFPPGGPSHRHSVDRVGFAPLAARAAGLGHHHRRDPHHHLASPKQVPFQPTRQVPAVLHRPDPLRPLAAPLQDGQELLAHELTHTIQHFGSPVLRRVAVGDRPFAEGYSTLIGTPEWRKATNSFERRLGAYAYGHAKSKAAAQAAVTRLAEVLRGYFNNDFADLNELWRAAFFKDDTSSAGQVGKELTNDEQLKLLFHGDGNLRELMTAFYNAAYYNSGYGNDLKNNAQSDSPRHHPHRGNGTSGTR